MVHKDCFAYKGWGYCNALTEMLCAKGKCSFYKTKEQFEEDLAKYPYFAHSRADEIRRNRDELH